MNAAQVTHTPKFDYYAARAADEAFQAELVRQFGNRAGDMRFAGKAKFDAATKHAHAVFLKVCYGDILAKGDAA